MRETAIAFAIRASSFQRHLKPLLFLAGAGMLVALVWMGWRQALHHLTHMSWGFFLSALLCTCGVLAVHTVRWTVIMNAIQAHEVGFPTAFRYVITSRYASLLVPQVVGMTGTRVGALIDRKSVV